MRKYLISIKFRIFLLILSSALLYWKGFTTYFHQDDFIHFWHSQRFFQVVSSLNIFQKGEFPFYRPIPTQIYFYFGRMLFGLNPFGYHLINFILFAANVILVYQFICLISRKKLPAFLGIIFYAVNTTHFAPLFSAAYVHELFYVFFGLLTMNFFLIYIRTKRMRYFTFSLIFFLGALMSKENAVVLPLLISFSYFFWKNKKKLGMSSFLVIPFWIILTVYLFGHFVFYGLAQSPSYKFIVGKESIQIFFWYVLWSLSTPNILIDFVMPRLSIRPVFFEITKFQGWLYLILFPIMSLIGIIMGIQFSITNFKRKNFGDLKILIFGILWFTIAISPLVIFPRHKLATQQAFSLAGLSLSIGYLNYWFWTRRKIMKIISLFFIILYVSLAINSLWIASYTHWIVRSAAQAKAVVDYLKKNYPQLADNAVVYFKNGQVKIPEYGSSRQIYQALGEGRGLLIILNKPNLQLYFEDINPLPINFKDRNIIEIDSSLFLGY